jgi:hypothetical protein
VFYVSPSSVYVWATQWRYYARPGDYRPESSVFRIPLDGSAPSALKTTGSPIDQFSFLEEAGQLNVLLRADDIVHDDEAPVKAQIVRKAFRGSEFLYTLRLASGEQLLAHVPSHHDHQLGEWIGIRAQVDHVVTFARQPL